MYWFDSNNINYNILIISNKFWNNNVFSYYDNTCMYFNQVRDNIFASIMDFCIKIMDKLAKNYILLYPINICYIDY